MKRVEAFQPGVHNLHSFFEITFQTSLCVTLSETAPSDNGVRNPGLPKA